MLLLVRIANFAFFQLLVSMEPDIMKLQNHPDEASFQVTSLSLPLAEKCIR